MPTESQETSWIAHLHKHILSQKTVFQRGEEEIQMDCPMFIEQVLVHLSGICLNHPTLYPIPLKSHPTLYPIPFKLQMKKIWSCTMVKLVESHTAGISI